MIQLLIVRIIKKKLLIAALEHIKFYYSHFYYLTYQLFLITEQGHQLYTKLIITRVDNPSNPYNSYDTIKLHNTN